MQLVARDIRVMTGELLPARRNGRLIQLTEVERTPVSIESGQKCIVGQNL
jgi:hypothetical protein